MKRNGLFMFMVLCLSSMTHFQAEARYYDARTGRFLSVDPKAGKYFAWSPYTYTLDNPLKYIDPNGKDAIPIVFKDYKISAFGVKWSGLGHAGILLIDNKTGTTKYYEYGRYDKEGKGLVRQRTVSDVVMDKNGMPNKESLTKVLGQISKEAGKGGNITGAYIKNDNFKEMNDYAQDRKSENSDPSREGYSIAGNNCGRFMKETLEAGQVDTPTMIVPWPNLYIEALRGKYPDVDYNAKKKQVTIEKEEKKKDGN
jgi:uncharacterized protein RhaS with RHS repeats